MARKTVKPRYLTRLGRVIVVCGFLVPGTAMAALSVIDQTNLAEAIKQLNVLKEQISVLTDTKKEIEGMFDSIGEALSIKVPLLNLAKIQRDLSTGGQCLIPDYKGLLPSIDFEDIRFDSLCDRDKAWRQIVLAPVEDGSQGLTVGERTAKAEQIHENRRGLFEDAATKGLSMSDQGLEGAMDLNEAAADLETANSRKMTLQERMDLMIRSNIAVIRGQAQQTQVLSQMLKLQSTAYLLDYGKTGVTALEEGQEDDE